MQREAEPGTAATHDHGLGQTPEGRIRGALILTLLTMCASIAGGIFAHSLALLSDAGHILADAGALALALVAQRVASRPRTHRRTYGSRRRGRRAPALPAHFPRPGPARGAPGGAAPAPCPRGRSPGAAGASPAVGSWTAPGRAPGSPAT